MSLTPWILKATWFMTNRLALIEIKWLGQSRDDTSRKNNYSVVRAKSGAKQLADYMDADKVQAPTHESRGYLVVVDARIVKAVTKSNNDVNRRWDEICCIGDSVRPEISRD